MDGLVFLSPANRNEGSGDDYSDTDEYSDKHRKRHHKHHSKKHKHKSKHKKKKKKSKHSRRERSSSQPDSDSPQTPEVNRNTESLSRVQVEQQRRDAGLDWMSAKQELPTVETIPEISHDSIVEKSQSVPPGSATTIHLDQANFDALLGVDSASQVSKKNEVRHSAVNPAGITAVSTEQPNSIGANRHSTSNDKGNGNTTVPPYIGSTDASTSQAAMLEENLKERTGHHTLVTNKYLVSVPKSKPTTPTSQTVPMLATASESAHDRNKLMAQALKAKLKGDIDEYNRLTGIANLSVIAGGSSPANARPSTTPRTTTSASLVSHQDMNGGGIRGEVHDLLVAERTKRAGTDPNEQYARGILRQGKRFKTGQDSRAGFDEDEQVANEYLNMGEVDESRAKKYAEVKEQQLHQQFQKYQTTNPLSPSNPKFRQDLVIWMGPDVFVMLPPNPFADGHCRIVPTKPATAFTMVDENVYSAMTTTKRIIQHMFDAVGMTTVCLETVTKISTLGWITCIECIPVGEEAAELVPMYFKKALLESDVEWTTHKRVIDTSQGGLKRSVPANFNYFHVEWMGGGYDAGGYAHVIEDKNLFPYTFGLDVLAGVTGKDPSKFNRKGNQSSSVAADRKRVDMMKFAWNRAVQLHQESNAT